MPCSRLRLLETCMAWRDTAWVEAHEPLWALIVPHVQRRGEDSGRGAVRRPVIDLSVKNRPKQRKGRAA